MHFVVNHQNIAVKCKIFDTMNDESKAYIADIQNAVDMVKNRF